MNNRIVIIGNGKTSLNKENGKFIDESDYVIRMNDFRDGYFKFIGSKTDIYVGGIKQIQSRSKDFFKLVKEVWCPYPKPPSPFFTQYDIETVEKVFNEFGIRTGRYIDELFLIDIIKKFKSLSLVPLDEGPCKGKIIKPSTGYLVIEMAFNFFSNMNVFLTGFDGFKTGHYWEESVCDGFCHPFEEELEKIKKFQRLGKLTIL